jgi:hypothetical protein
MDWPTFGDFLHKLIWSPGVDVMFTIFWDFLTILGGKIGVFLKDQCCDQNFAYFIFVSSQKRQFFSPKFSAKKL